VATYGKAVYGKDTYGADPVPVPEPSDEDLVLVSPYELTHEIELPLGVGQNPTADVYVANAIDPFDKGRRAKGKKVTGDGPRTKERHAPVDPIIG
jgi:hypothetical protein